MFKDSLKTIALSLITLSFVGIAYATWAEPTAIPPDGNISSPLTNSGTAQTKSGGLWLNSGGAPMGLIVENGNVGIGTTAPAGKLHINNAVDDPASMLLSRQGSTDVWGVYRYGSAGNDRFGIGIIGVNEPFIITKEGNVGIGTTTPTAKLEIGGIPGTDGIKFPDGTKQTTAVGSGSMVLGGYEIKSGGGGNISCSAGKSLLGGGCGSPNEGANYYLQSSSPVGTNGWHCSWTSGGGIGTVYAICANVLSGAYLVNSRHIEGECTALGGTVSTDASGNKFCKFSGSSCSSGWTKYNNWSTTSAKSSNYFVLENNGNSPANNCSYAPSNSPYPCGARNSTCSVSGHTWSDVLTETKTCSTAHPIGYWSAGDACILTYAPYPFDCYDWAIEQGYTAGPGYPALETTITANISEIGCY